MRKIKTANNNQSSGKVFDINLLQKRPFELSRLEGFVDGKDDIFDVLSGDKRDLKRSRHIH